LVVGDVIILEAGDAVPADARLLECASLKCEEAALTGESVPVEKTVDAIAESADGRMTPLGDRKNMVYMGSTAVYGRAKAVITGTGMETEMGKIAGALADAGEEKTPLQLKLAQLSRILTYIVLGICGFIFAFQLIAGGSFTLDAILDTFIIAVSLAVAAIPEGLAAVVTIELSIGVTRMSKKGAVIRKMSAVETLGCTEIICSDKTGTLTQNKMTVVETACTKDDALLARAMALCSDAKPGEDGQAVGEPTECALVNFAAKAGPDKTALDAESPRIGEIPFDSDRKMMTTVCRTTDGALIQYTKGAPDEILARSAFIDEGEGARPMTEADREAILAANKGMADRALRVLAAAYKRHDAEPAVYSSEAMECELVFCGLTGMIDPVRPEVKAAIEECRTAGIRPIMITGDHKDTAVAIATELGIISSAEEAITGAELNEIPDEEFAEGVTKYSVYARVQPEHKLRIVRAWRAKDKVTAMTGDGVNDAPSIKGADIGVGMGITGTDVTKNVADMILADDNFATIVGAAEEGRRIYDNIRRAIRFLLSSNLAEVVGIFIFTILGLFIGDLGPALLLPTHILFVNLITDSLPARALGMEAAEKNIMNRPPRKKNEGIFAGGMAFDIAYEGVLIGLLTLAAYLIGHYLHPAGGDGTTMAFLTLSMAEIFHSYNMRSERGSLFSVKTHNLFLFGAMALAFVLTLGVIYIPFFQNAFNFTPVSLGEYAIALGLAFSVLPIVELVKLVRRKLAK
ncbi:MAG: cation-translocating P-type ATPase, partial [Clostridia bacterium]|nr:cation-translocating P-type ATPase [Clostridia bacterium]